MTWMPKIDPYNGIGPDDVSRQDLTSGTLIVTSDGTQIQNGNGLLDVNINPNIVISPLKVNGNGMMWSDSSTDYKSNLKYRLHELKRDDIRLIKDILEMSGLTVIDIQVRLSREDYTLIDVYAQGDELRIPDQIMDAVTSISRSFMEFDGNIKFSFTPETIDIPTLYNDMYNEHFDNEMAKALNE